MLFSPIKPMLLQMGKEVIDDPNIIFDIKWDGWRILLHKSGNRVEAYTRHGNNVTAKFPELEEVGRSIKEHTAIIDCEGVVIRKGGVPNFEDFAHRGMLTNKDKIAEATQTHPATFIAFDVLATSKNHTSEPLSERKKRLSTIIEPSNSLMVTPSIVGEGSRIFQLTKERNMEGIVAKHRDSTYQINHRSSNWKKIKHFKIAQTVILGYKENPFTMIVGTRLKNGQYKAIANVEMGFKQDEKAAFRKIVGQIAMKKKKDVTWLEPRLICSVQYLEKTEKGSLRIVSFKGFNFDLTPDECMAI